jgi:hypothetical protein
MSRAMVAVAKSHLSALVEKLHLEPDEVARIGAGIVVDYGRRAGLDRRGIVALVEDAEAGLIATRRAE